MTCGGCARRVEQVLAAVPGAIEPVVDLLSESATLRLNDDAIPNADVLKAVRDAGYDAEVVAGGRQLLDRYASDAESKETIRRHRQGMIQAVGLALPIMLLDHFMHMFWGHAFEKQITARLMQIILLVMMSLSPGAAPILVGGLRAMIHRAGNMDLLVTMGVLAAFTSSLWGIFVAKDASFIHLDAAAMILAFICVGRYLESRAKVRAAAAMSALARRSPTSALVRRDDAWVSTPVDRIAVGDEIAVPPLEPIPVDGEIIDGEAAVDESLMTGEPMPIRRTVGDSVKGGSLVTEGRIVVRAASTGERSTLGRIVDLVQKAQSTRTNAQRTADRVAGVFVPIVILIAFATFAGWLLVGGAAHASDAARAAAAVLVVACPCAMGLATPTVVTVATGLAALRGILVRDAETLEAAGRIDVVVWDKTGTLTSGRPIIQDIELTADASESEVLRFAAGAEQFSTHPLAGAIVREAKKRGIALPEPSDFHVEPGRGVTAVVDGRRVDVGRLDEASLSKDASSSPSNAATRVGVRIDGELSAVIRIADAIRPSARRAIERLATLGVRSEMLTGDSRSAAAAVADTLGLPPDAVNAEASPEMKVRRIGELCSSPDRVHRVAMVGDGVNDAAALAAADVGIAFAAGASMAGEASGIQLVGSTPHLVADAVQLARGAGRIIRQNLFWAFFYNVLMIPLAAVGKLSPEWAAAAMILSSLTVVLNALRLPGWFSRVAREGWQGDAGAVSPA